MPESKLAREKKIEKKFSGFHNVLFTIYHKYKFQKFFCSRDFLVIILL